MLTRSQWAAKRAEKGARQEAKKETLREKVRRWQTEPMPESEDARETTVSAQPCELRGCILWPSVHSHSYKSWPDPRRSSDYQWENTQWQAPLNLTSEWTLALEGDKCQHPRTRCKIIPGETPLLRHKATGSLYCKRHTLQAVYGPDIIERIKKWYQSQEPKDSPQPESARRAATSTANTSGSRTLTQELESTSRRT